MAEGRADVTGAGGQKVDDGRCDRSRNSSSRPPHPSSSSLVLASFPPASSILLPLPLPLSTRFGSSCPLSTLTGTRLRSIHRSGCRCQVALSKGSPPLPFLSSSDTCLGHGTQPLLRQQRSTRAPAALCKDGASHILRGASRLGRHRLGRLLSSAGAQHFHPLVARPTFYLGSCGASPPKAPRAQGLGTARRHSRPKRLLLLCRSPRTGLLPAIQPCLGPTPEPLDAAAPSPLEHPAPWNSSRILRSNSISSAHSQPRPISKSDPAAAASQAALEVFHTENAVILNEVHLTPPTARDPAVVDHLRHLELLRRIIDVFGAILLAALHAGDWATGWHSRATRSPGPQCGFTSLASRPTRSHPSTPSSPTRPPSWPYTSPSPSSTSAPPCSTTTQTLASTPEALSSSPPSSLASASSCSSHPLLPASVRPAQGPPRHLHNHVARDPARRSRNRLPFASSRHPGRARSSASASTRG